MPEIHVIDLRGKSHKETVEILKNASPELLQAMKAAGPELIRALDGIAQKKRAPKNDCEKSFVLAQSIVSNAGIDLEDFYNVCHLFSKKDDTYEIGLNLMAVGACLTFSSVKGLSSLKTFKAPDGGIVIRSKSDELLRIEISNEDDKKDKEC